MSGCSHATTLVASTLVQRMGCDQDFKGAERLATVSLPSVSAALLTERGALPLAKKLAHAVMLAHPSTLGVLEADVEHRGTTLTARVRLLVVAAA